MPSLGNALYSSMYRSGRFLCRFRGTAFANRVASAVAAMAEQLENVNWDFEKNGERRVLERMRLCTPKCAFDVGANRGDWCTKFAALYPSCEIHAFEVVPATFEQLRDSVESNPNIILNNFGLSDETATIILSVADADSSVASACPIKGMKYHDQYYTRQVQGQVRKAVDYVRENGIGTIDFLKVDVEGMYLKVLKGLENAISQARVIQFEYGIFNSSLHDLLSDFFVYLSGKGFIVGRIFPRHVDFFDYHFSREKFYGGNYVAVKRDEDTLITALAAYGR